MSSKSPLKKARRKQARKLKMLHGRFYRINALLGKNTPHACSKFRDLKLLNTVRIASLADIKVLLVAIYHMHKEVAVNSSLHSMRAQRIYSLRTNVVPLSASLADYAVT